MFATRVLRHVLIPTAAIIAEKTKSTECCCRPSELPVYTYDTPITSNPDKPSEIEKQFQEAIGSARRNIFSVMGNLKEVKEKGEDFISDGYTRIKCYIEILQEDDTTTPKYGAIAIGGLTGLIFGLRGGFFKRIVYTSAGALGMAALCYPKEANEYSQILFEEANRYVIIAYNFMYGVKKGDPPLELPSLPTLPNSLSELWNSAKSMTVSKSSFSANVTDKTKFDTHGKEDSDQKKLK